MQETEYNYIFKFIIIGNSAVGKSSMLIRYADDFFEDKHLATIGVDFRLKTLEIDNKVVKLQIWDTAGQERFKNIIASYYKGAAGVFVVYDVSDKDSFDNLNTWLIEIEKHAPKNVDRVLIGNKCDVVDKKVSTEQAKEFAESNGMKFFEVSAKNNINISEAFQHLAEKTFKNRLPVKPNSVKIVKPRVSDIIKDRIKCCK